MSLDASLFLILFFFFYGGEGSEGGEGGGAEIDALAKYNFLACKHKNMQKLVRLRYAMFLSELLPLSFP